MQNRFRMAQLTNHHSFDATAISLQEAPKAAGGDASAITLNDMILFAVQKLLKTTRSQREHDRRRHAAPFKASTSASQ
jgi:hypothetical protein